MREIIYLTKRNCRVFLRDKAAVFFSFLSMLIILGLMVVFLGKMNSDELISVLAEYGGERDTVQDQKNATYLIQLWTLAGILVVNSVTVTLTVMGTMVQDETRKRIMAFYVTSVNRIKLSLGYILSSWLVGTGMCVITLAVGELYFVLQGHGLLAAVELFKLVGLIALSAFTFSALGYLLALFVHSDSAWSGILTIIGTLVGFAGGIYLPLSSLSETVQKVLKCIPVLPGAAMMREVCTAQAIRETFDGLPEAVADGFKERMGITLYRGEVQIELWQQVTLLLIYAIIAIVVATLVNRKRKLKDR